MDDPDFTEKVTKKIDNFKGFSYGKDGFYGKSVRKGSGKIV